MGGTSSIRSDHRQALLPLLLHPAPHQALFLGVGTGATVVGGSQMPGVTVHGVELSREWSNCSLVRQSRSDRARTAADGCGRAALCCRGQ